MDALNPILITYQLCGQCGEWFAFPADDSDWPHWRCLDCFEAMSDAERDALFGAVEE